MKSFKEFLLEKNNGHFAHIDAQNKKLLKKWKISKKDIEKAKKDLARFHKVKDPNSFDFHAIWDYEFEDYVDILFNIEDPTHKKHRSTVSYPWNPKERRGKLKD